MTNSKILALTSATTPLADTMAVRYLTTYEEDGTVLPGNPVVTGKYINPGDDYADKDLRVAAMCPLAQTLEVIAA